MASSPRINTQLGARQTLELRRKARPPVHRRSACSGLKALRNTSDARRQAAKLRYRFGPLTPSARSANLIAGDGTKNNLPAPNKELTANPKQSLDRKSPIQVRIHLPPAVSPVRTTGSGATFAMGRVAGREMILRSKRYPGVDRAVCSMALDTD